MPVMFRFNQHCTWQTGTSMGIRLKRTELGVAQYGPAVATELTPLLGALTLESLGLMVNPVTRELLPMRLFLALSRIPASADSRAA
jgi:hypothetical protein